MPSAVAAIMGLGFTIILYSHGSSLGSKISSQVQQEVSTAWKQK